MVHIASKHPFSVQRLSKGHATKRLLTCRAFDDEQLRKERHGRRKNRTRSSCFEDLAVGACRDLGRLFRLICPQLN